MVRYFSPHVHARFAIASGNFASAMVMLAVEYMFIVVLAVVCDMSKHLCS